MYRLSADGERRHEETEAECEHLYDGTHTGPTERDLFPIGVRNLDVHHDFPQCSMLRGAFHRRKVKPGDHYPEDQDTRTFLWRTGIYASQVDHNDNYQVEHQSVDYGRHRALPQSRELKRKGVIG